MRQQRSRACHVHRGVPVGIEEDDAVRAREIQSETSHAGGEEEEEDIPAGVEEVDESLALGEGSGAVHAAVAEGLDERGERGKPEWRGRAR